MTGPDRLGTPGAGSWLGYRSVRVGLVRTATIWWALRTRPRGTDLHERHDLANSRKDPPEKNMASSFELYCRRWPPVIRYIGKTRT